MPTEHGMHTAHNASDEDVQSEDSDDDADDSNEHFLLPPLHASSAGAANNFREQEVVGSAEGESKSQLKQDHSRWNLPIHTRLKSLINTFIPARSRNPRSKTATEAGEEPSSPSAWIIIRRILAYSWLNVLLVFVPVGIVTYLMQAHPIVVFTSNALAIIPLSTLLSCGTENVAYDMGDTVGALLNVSFGNAVELLILTALTNGQTRLVQASLLGSILVNLLLILGTAILAGSLQQREQVYNQANAQSLACLLSLSAFSFVVPTAFHASFRDKSPADEAVLRFSRGTAVILLLIYMIYLFFQLRSHIYLHVSVTQHVFEEESQTTTLAGRRHEQPSFRNRSPSTLSGNISVDEAGERQTPVELKTVVSRNTVGPNSGSHARPEAEDRVLGATRLSEPTIKFTEQSTVRGRPLDNASPSLRPRKHSQTTSRSQHTSRQSSQSRLSEDLFLHRPRTSSVSLVPESGHVHLPKISTSYIGRRASLLLLLTSSILIAVNAEFLVYSIDDMVANSPLSSFFIGLIILPIAGNVAEHITAMTVAWRSKMDLALGVSIGSSIQIALFVMPLVVIIGWGLDQPMTLYFSLFETVTLVASVFVVNVLILNGRTNYLEGTLLCACYIMTMLGAFLYPSANERLD